jgi:hypothetical protein
MQRHQVVRITRERLQIFGLAQGRSPGRLCLSREGQRYCTQDRDQ